MDELLYWVLIIIISLIIVLIPTVISIWIYRFLKKRQLHWKWRILAFIPLLVLGYFIYIAFYPSEDFYQEDFKEVTGFTLPENSHFIFKTSSYPDNHGDYTSVSIVEIGEEHIDNIETKLLKQGLTENDNRLGGIEMNKAKSTLKQLEIKREFSKQEMDKFYYVAILSDNKTILVQRSSH